MTEEDALDQFVEEILTAKGFQGMDDDSKSYLKDDLKTTFKDVLNRAVIEALPDNQMDGFNALLDDNSKTPDDLHQFIIQSGVDVNKVTLDTMIRFRELYLETPEQRDQANSQNNIITEA